MNTLLFVLIFVGTLALRDIVLRWIDLANLLDERDRLRQYVKELERTIIDMGNRNN